MATETLYVKKGNRYVPAGIHTDIDMYPGIWLVQKTTNSNSMSSICLSELPEISSLIEIVQARLIGKLIMERFFQMIQADQLHIYDKSLYELEYEITDTLVEHLNKVRKTGMTYGYNEFRINGVELARKTFEEILEPTDKNTWHGQDTSKIKRLFNDVQEIANHKLGTHEFFWYLRTIETMLIDHGFDLNHSGIGGLLINPEE